MSQAYRAKVKNRQKPPDQFRARQAWRMVQFGECPIYLVQFILYALHDLSNSCHWIQHRHCTNGDKKHGDTYPISDIYVCTPLTEISKFFDGYLVDQERCGNKDRS